MQISSGFWSGNKILLNYRQPLLQAKWSWSQNIRLSAEIFIPFLSSSDCTRFILYFSLFFHMYICFHPSFSTLSFFFTLLARRFKKWLVKNALLRTRKFFVKHKNLCVFILFVPYTEKGIFYYFTWPHQYQVNYKTIFTFLMRIKRINLPVQTADTKVTT